MTDLMKGKRGLVMGVANDHSIAWGIARKLSEHGAELAFSYQGEAFGRRVKPLAEKVGASMVVPCDVEDSASVAQTFATLGEAWGAVGELSGTHQAGVPDTSQALVAASWNAAPAAVFDLGYARGLTHASPRDQFFAGMTLRLCRLF